MSEIKHKDLAAEMHLRAIELLSSTINLPAVPNTPITDFTFNINVESKVDGANKLIFVVVTVEIKSEDPTHILGSVMVSCIYHLANFDKVINQDPAGTLDIPAPLVEMLNSISISTTRGVMFSTFRGTYLHNAVLPIIHPGSL